MGQDARAGAAVRGEPMTDHPEQANALRTLQDWWNELWADRLLYGEAVVDARKVPEEFRALVISDLAYQHRIRKFRARALRWMRSQG